MSTLIQASFSEIQRQRRSVRGFKPEPISEIQLESIFSLAQWSPSNCNTQPWLSHVASGQVIERLRHRLPEAFTSGHFSMDFPYDANYQGVYKDRQFDAANQLYTAMGIDRADRERRNSVFLDNFSFFGAPHVVFLFLPEPFGIREAADVGQYAQSLMLSISSHGAASCPQTSLGFLADVIKEELGIASDNKLLFGISFGYEDPDNLANRCRVERAPLAETTTFHQ